MNEYQEVEYKYNANDVGLEDFNKLMLCMPVKKSLDISSWDVYYTKDGENAKFQRFRNSDSPELTKKIKVNTSNNWIRVEVDLPLDKNRITEHTVSKFVGIDGYKENFRIYKTCFVRWLNDINIVYYIVYDTSLRETGRFIEIELNKDFDLDDSRTTPIDTLNFYEQTYLSKLGLSHRHRLKKSLFEIYFKQPKEDNV